MKLISDFARTRAASVAVASASLLSACATSTLTSQEASQYAGMTLPQFLDARFTDRQSKHDGGNIYYTAYFNDVNYRQLTRPRAEIARFCRAQGGEPVRAQAYIGNPVARFFPDPTIEAMRTFSYAARKGYSQDVSSGAAANAFAETARLNGRYEAADAMRAFSAAAEQVTYGLFECRTSATPNSPAWRVSITPIGYLPKDSNNDLTTHKLIIAIRAE
jgi:hypothetical protein